MNGLKRNEINEESYAFEEGDWWWWSADLDRLVRSLVDDDEVVAEAN